MPKIVLPVPDNIYHAAYQESGRFMLKSVEDVLVEWLQDGYREEVVQEVVGAGVGAVLEKDEPTLYRKTA